MKQLTDKFVIAKRDIESSSGALVQKDDVGIIRAESGESAFIFFMGIIYIVTLK